jgi:predicted nucleotidyltransferase
MLTDGSPAGESGRRLREVATPFAEVGLYPTQAQIENIVIPAMVELIVRAFDPLKIILFGSQARGEANFHSDVDLLVVLEAVENKREAAIAIRESLAHCPVAKDIVVTTPQEIARRGTLIGTVLEPALREGKVVYERV